LPRRVEQLELKLTAYLHQRPCDAAPAAVGRLVRLHAVNRAVEDAHHLAAADVEGDGKDDRPAEKAGDPPRQRRFAVARRAIDKDGRARVDGRTHGLHDTWG